jgi:hypothetical protein
LESTETPLRKCGLCTDTPQHTVPWLKYISKDVFHSLGWRLDQKDVKSIEFNSETPKMSQVHSLPAPVTGFLSAIRDKDPNLFAESFDLHAVLEDEATTYNGRAAVKAWGADALIAHNTTVLVQNVTPSNDDTLLLEVIMDGDFKESYGITDPFTLYMTFTISPSSVIQSLIITDVDPSTPSMFAVWAPKGNLHDPLSSLRLGQRPVPSVPEGWVKVKVTAAGLNWHDIFTLKGIGPNPSRPLTFPLILGCEATGTLEDGTPVLLYPVMTSSAIPTTKTTSLSTQGDISSANKRKAHSPPT